MNNQEKGEKNKPWLSAENRQGLFFWCMCPTLWDLCKSSAFIFNRRSRVRAVVTRGSTGLVGQNTSCKVHKVCISLWPTGWDDVRTRADESPF